MSSILRALKKLESDSRHLGENSTLDAKFVPLADTGSRRSAFSFFNMAGAGIICGLVVLAGWYFFSGRLQTLPSETAAPPSRNSKAVPVSPSQPLDRSETPAKTIIETPEKISIQESVETVPAAQNAEQPEPAGSAGPTRPVDTLQTALPADQLPTGETVKVADAPSMPENEPVVQSAEPAAGAAGRNVAPAVKNVSAVEIPKLNDPDMKLQAITWSRAPQKRIAVINNRIVREGESVSGYLISTINQDDIVLSREGRKWQLLFRIK